MTTRMEKPDIESLRAEVVKAVLAAAPNHGSMLTEKHDGQTKQWHALVDAVRALQAAERAQSEPEDEIENAFYTTARKDVCLVGELWLGRRDFRAAVAPLLTREKERSVRALESKVLGWIADAKTCTNLSLDEIMEIGERVVRSNADSLIRQREERGT